MCIVSQWISSVVRVWLHATEIKMQFLLEPHMLKEATVASDNELDMV